MSGIGGLNHPDNHDGVLTHLEPDILECEVKRTLEVLRGTKLVEVMEFQEIYLKKKQKKNKNIHLIAKNYSS